MNSSKKTALIAAGSAAIFFGCASVALAADASVQSLAEAATRPVVAGGTVAGAGVIGFLTWVRQRLSACKKHRRKHTVKLLYFP